MRGLIFILLTGIWTAQAASFVRDVQPLLKQHCVKCHGPEKQKRGYRIDMRD